MLRSTRQVLESIAEDMRGGLLETVGVESRLSFEAGKCSIILELPQGINTPHIARAIDAENVEAWCDRQNRVHVAVNPWYSTKDVEQAVLCAIKVIHVLLGLHAGDKQAPLSPPMSFTQKLLKSISEIIDIQQKARKK